MNYILILYQGMGSNKNVLNTLFLSFICMGIVTVQFILFGYSLAFGPSNNNNQIGSFSQGLTISIDTFIIQILSMQLHFLYILLLFFNLVLP